MFFALLWGVIFKHFIIRQSGHWSILIAAMVVSGTIAPLVLAAGYYIVTLGSLTRHVDPLGPGPSLLWFVFGVGVPEEFVKGAPVAAYLV